MAVVGVGSLTLYDHNEMLYALLVSDAGLVPVNASGTPITPLSTTPLTTRMNVYRGSVLETGWTFSKAQTNATSTINSATGVLSVTAVSADSAYVDITASKSGEPSITKRYSITKVYQGDPGQTGPTGPVGISGQLGLATSGSTLILGSFSSSGAFQAASGIMCVSGSDGLTVPTYSLALTGSGMGYVLYNPAWASPRFAKMSAQSSGTAHWIEWKDYNTAAVIDISGNTFVFGSFKYINAMFSEMKIFTGYEPEDFCKSHLIELLAKEDISDATDWAQALGAQQVFKRLAAVEMLAANLVVQNAKSPNYAEDASGTPTAGFNLDGPNSSMKSRNAVMKDMTAEGGTFTGKIKHEALETMEYKGGTNNSVVLSNTKDLWLTTKLYNDLTGITENIAPVSASGTYGGKTINGISRLSNSTKQSFLTVTRSASIGEDEGPTILDSITIPAGCDMVEFSGYSGASMSGYDAGFRIMKTPAGGGANVSVWRNTSDVANRTLTWPAVPGDVFTCSIWGYVEDAEDPVRVSGQAGPYTLKALSAHVGPGVLLRFTDGTYSTILQGQYRDDVLTLSSPSWSSASNLQYKKGDALFTQSVISGLTGGIVYTASGTLTYDALGASSENLTVLSVLKNASSVTLNTNNGTRIINIWPAQGSTSGAYDGYSTNFIIVEQMRSVLVSSLLRKSNGDGKDFNVIGTQNEPFVEGNFTTVNGTQVNGNVNSAGTTKIVYGAVFN